jgi:RNA polymerase sigma-70 factor (ECF subfamily)
LALSDEQTLIERAQRGEIAAFEALLKPHLPSIRRFAYSFCRSWTDADDLAQEALIRAYRSLRSFGGRSAFSTWLYAVTRSACLDWRRGRIFKAQAAEKALEEGPVDQRDPQDVLVERKSEVEQLWRAIRRLDPRFRIPLVLFDIEGMSYEQIAAIERVPVGTVRSRLARARGRLETLLGAQRTARVAPTGSGTEPATPSSKPFRSPVS